MSEKTKTIPFDLDKAKQGAKVVTRGGCSARIVDYKVKDENYPILGLIYKEDIETPKKFTIDGKYYLTNDDALDLFIEEDVEKEVEETDDYNPYKETVKSIADMVERYANNGDLQDFYDNVKVKCREAVEYEKKWCKNQEEQKSYKEETTHRLMTYQELADWLRDNPEEYREYTYEDSSTIRNNFTYCDEDASKLADDILVRRNHGEWEKPLVVNYKK